MLVPTNAPAETIDKLNKENYGYTQQINTLSEWVADNERIISELTPIATWEDVVEEPLPADPGDGLAPVSEFPGMIVIDPVS